MIGKILLAGLVIMFAAEIVALAVDHKQTLTRMTITWMKSGFTLRRRIMVGLFIVWLFWHFVFQFFN